jgi:hypothetical protein
MEALLFDWQEDLQTYCFQAVTTSPLLGPAYRKAGNRSWGRARCLNAPHPTREGCTKSVFHQLDHLIHLLLTDI